MKTNNIKEHRIFLVKTELGLPLNSTTFSLFKGDILFCEKNKENSDEKPYLVSEVIYTFNNKEELVILNKNKPYWKRVTSLFNLNDLIPIEILVRDGLLEDITRYYKIKKLLE